MNNRTPAQDPDKKANENRTEPAADPQRKTARYNPRLVFTDPDSFFSDLLMEQNEQH